MGRFDDAADRLGAQGSNPAAPAGLQQAAGRQAAERGRFADAGKLQQWSPTPYDKQAQDWFSGANNQDTKNGWDSEFTDAFISGWDDALANGTARSYFESDNATGVVTWDHLSTDTSRQFKFGDVFENGKYKGNLYDQFDKNTANLMMAPWLLDDDTQAKTFAAEDRMERLDEEITRSHEDRNTNFETTLKQSEFNADVAERTQDIQEGAGDQLIAGGGVLGGIALGAGLGTAAGPFGTVIGGIAGGIAGGVGAWMNRDALSEQAARAAEISQISFHENGFAAGLATGVTQWSGFGGKMISPLSNLVQGSYDAGHRGDGQSEFYRLDAEGERKAGTFIKVADVAATLGDALLQFASPLGAAAYTAQMTGTIVGEVGELALTGGETFDYKTAAFDNVFTDDDGNFDASAAAAGIGKIGIDAVQLGMARGLMGKADAGLAEAGQQSAYKTGLGKLSEKLPLWAGGSRGLAEGERRVTEAGFKFTRGADGSIVEGSGRATLSILAPSEQLTALSARVTGMRAAAKANGAYSADDFYRAAQGLAAGERKVTTTIVNAMGEGYEEAIQAVLEPHSHGHSIDFSEVGMAAIYGAASGAGMAGATAFRGVSADEKMFALAQVGELLTTGGSELTRDQWKAMTDLEKRQRAALGSTARATADAAFRKIVEDQAAEHVAGVAGISKLADAIESAKSQELARATDRTDGSFVITQLEELPELDADGNLVYGAVPVDAAQASARQTAANLNNHHKGLVIGLGTLKKKLADAEARAAADPADADAAAEVASRTEQIAKAELALEWAQRFDEVLGRYVGRILDPAATQATRDADTAELNDLLRRAFNRTVDDYQGTLLTEDDKTALAKAVSLVFVRDPQDQSGSYQMLVPQVSARLTEAGADNVLEVSHAILPAISGDYDGDKMRQQAQLILDDTEFTSARAGAHFLGVGASVNVGAPKYEKYIVEYLAESLTGTRGVNLQALATATLTDIGSAIRKRYDGVVDPATLDLVLKNFFDAVEANDKDARATLLDGLADMAGGEITEFARANLSSEWLWLDQLVGSTFQRFQESYAAHRPDLGADVDTTTAAPNAQSADVRTRRAEKAATLGETLGLWAPGDSMFRKFQKLHYTAMGAPVLSAHGLEATSLTEMAELYRELGQRVTRTELERVRGTDDIAARVYVQLAALAADAQKLHPDLDRHQALVVVANLRVDDLDVDEQGEFFSTGHSVSLAQMLLKQAVTADQREKARILDASPELKAKHARLMAMTRPNSRDYPHGAELAFVEAVGSQQLYTLLGEDALVFGPHLTVEQFLRQYVSLSESDRTDLAREVLFKDPAYLGRKQVKDMPYDLDEVAGGEVSAFRAVVDSILAVGNSRISIDAAGKLHGEVAERSNRTAEDFRAAHRRIRYALQEFAGLSPKHDNDLSVELVQRLLEGNPDFARALMDLIPNAAAAASFRIEGKQVYVANWLYTLFTIRDEKEAEMHYWRNLLLAEWNALGVRVTEEGEEGEAARRFDRLPRRMHRVMYRLAAERDGGLMYRRFITELETATDLDTFLSWVNTTPGLRGEQAPLTAWVDDVAEFDMDKAQGGWTTALAGAELREAITMLRSRSESLVTDLVSERTSMKNDARIRAALHRVLRKDAGEDVTLDAGDRELYDRFVKAIELAGDWHVATGPQAMVNQTFGALQQFYASAHTKGKNPAHVSPAGALDAQRDAFDFVTNYERFLASMTAVNLDAVGSNLAQVAKDGGRSMDDTGRLVEWESLRDADGHATPAAVKQMLDLLDDAETRPFARAVLFPQVMEVGADNVLRPQMLVGKSLSELLRGVSYKQLFPSNGRLSQEAAFKYIAMVEGVARKYNGHNAVQRAVNDLVIARTSAAGHVLSAAEQESMVTRAYHEVALVLQAVGSLASRPHSPGTDPLAAIMENVRATQRKMRVARMLGVDSVQAEEVTDATIDAFILEREKEFERDKQALLKQASDDPANQQRYLDEVAAAEADFERFKHRVDLLRTDDVAGQVVEMFSIDGDPTQLAAKKQKLVEYVLAHLSMLESASASMLLLRKLTNQVRDSGRNGQVTLSDKEWGELSRAVIGHYLDDVASTSAAGVSVAPWPDEDRAEDRKYFDSSWAYLVEDMLRSDGPLAQAARDVHRMAGRQNDTATTEAEFYDLLGRTVLDGKRLGPWTSDIPRASIEPNQRLDSAPAEPAIAMPGNSPKRLAAIMAATRRTTVVPDEALLSTAQLSWLDLNRELFDEVTMTVPDPVGTRTDVSRPLAQLNNRFARSVTMQVVDASGTVQTIDLLAESRQLGRKFHGSDEVANSPYSEIHVGRLKRAVDTVARSHNVDPAQALVTVEFFHPDSQPEGPEWFNNVYFEGTSFNLDADRFESLPATLWFAYESLNQSNQRTALDASKLGKAALQVIETMPAAERAAIEANWASDLGAVLRMKTQAMLTKDLGFGTLEPEFYNAVYKDLKLRHFVRTPDGGLLAAEQVLAMQARGEDLPPGSELWIPTDDVLRTMLGEQGNQGVLGITEQQLEFDPSTIPTYRGVTPRMLELFDGRGERTPLHKTRIANRARQQQLTVRAMLDEKTRNAFDAKMRVFRERQAEIFTDRGEAQRTDGIGFNAKKNLKRAVRAGKKMLNAENLAFHWSSIGVPFGPRKPEDTVLSKMLLSDLSAAMEADGFRTGWVYREGSPAKPQAGLLSEVSLGAKDRPAYRVAPGDLVVVELDSFGGDTELAKKRINYLSDNGAIVLLGATDGQADMRAELAEYLISDRQYEPIAGSTHAYQPGEFGSRFQNQRARASTLTAMHPIRRKSRVATLLVSGLPVHENAAWANHDNERLSSISVSANLVPSSAMAGFNVPATPAQIAAVQAQLRGLDTPEGRKFLKAAANEKLKGAERALADAEFDAAYDALIRRFDDFPGAILPQPGSTFGKGDIIPLIDSVGRVQLYRHGYKALRRDQIDEQTSRTLPGSLDAVNVAVFPTKPETAATIHSGEVVEFRQRAGFGLSVELLINEGVYGAKKQLEMNGMKYVLSPKPDSVVLPDHGFFPDWGIDLIASMDDTVSKEAFGDLVNNHANAFAFFGIDFTADVTEFFFPGRGKDGDAQAAALEMLHAISTRSQPIPVLAAEELLRGNRVGAAITELLPAGALPDMGWVARLNDQAPVENRITAALVVYLMTPGARVSDVLRTGGLNADNATGDTASQVMPRLFTQIFDDAPLGSALRTEMNRRFNAQLHNPHNDGTGYVLHEDWTFEVRNSDPGKNLRGFLQFSEAHSSGDNPVKNGMSFDEAERQQVSQHSANIAYGAIGAETAYVHDIAKARILLEGSGVTRFERDVLDGGAWRMLTDIPKQDRAFHNWRMPTPAESARRENAREALVQFRQPITKTEMDWVDAKNQPTKLATEYADLTHTIARALGLLDAQADIVDYWVRQVLGMPHGTDAEGHELGRVTAKGAVEAARDIRDNILEGYLPTLGAEVPMLHLHDLQLIYRANKHRSSPWKPRESMGNARTVESWNDWVEVSLGSALTSDNLFDPLYLLALDGFMHTYQNATRSLMDLPVSIDSLVAQQLLDPGMNRMVTSINSDADLLASDPILLDVVRASVEDLVGGKRIAGKFQGKAAPASEIAKRRDARRRWRKENGVPVPVDVTMKNFRKNGAEFVDHATTTNAFVRGLINLRVGTALINPALYVSMGPEQWIRGGLDRAANLLTGQSTAGMVAGAAARVGLSRFTPEQIRNLQSLYAVLGQRNDFKGMVYRDLMFQRPHAHGIGKIERALEAYAKFGARIQDPTWGMRADTMARRYVEAALQHILATPTINVIDIDTLVAQLRVDPTFLQKNYPEAHQAASNAIAQIRSLKQTTASMALRGIYEPLSESSHAGVNLFGNLVLKIPMLFSGYALNVATSVLGLQGLDQMTAMFLEGRQKPGTLFHRVSAKLAGKEFTPEEDATFDMSSVLEGIDLSRAFIRGGLTHAALFSLGLAAGGLGLSGEDDEMKKRRRLAELQGVGVLYDPRRVENDFRNADALYVDNIPFLGSLFKAEATVDENGDGVPEQVAGRSLVQMHWMLKQFISPIMGFEKFYETGDFRHVTWGFEDALGSFPLINTMMWKDTVETAHALAAEAGVASEDGTPAGAVAGATWLASAVGTYERMLFENSFVNQLYVGLDEWDRDPYVLPLRDSNGEIQRDIANNARPNDTALAAFVDPKTGEVGTSYMGRTAASTERHILTENRASMAAIMSLFTGGIGESDYWRYNMPIKLREVEKPEVTQDLAEVQIRAALHGLTGGGVQNVTAEELYPTVKGELIELGRANGHFYTDDEAWAEAERRAKQYGTAKLSLVDKEGREHLTTEGARAIFRGLYKGTMTTAQASQGGFYINPEMREQITNEWSKELIQEGIDLGLDQTKATSRMKRIMFGAMDGSGTPGLADLIWSKDISFTDTGRYKQHNTTYVIGPDGLPWATGFTRDKLMGALGLAPLKGQFRPEGSGTTLDGRLNTVDLVAGMNTGLRALTPLDESEYVPTDAEIGEKIEKAIKDAAKEQYTPFQPFEKKNSSGYGGWNNYGGYRRYGGYGGYGGYSGSGGGYFTRMNPLPNNVAPYGNSASFINTSNPNIRRAYIRRERVWSERGRLKQWQ